MNLKNTISLKNLVKSFFAFRSIYYGVSFFGLFAAMGFIGDTLFSWLFCFLKIKIGLILLQTKKLVFWKLDSMLNFLDHY